MFDNSERNNLLQEIMHLDEKGRCSDCSRAQCSNQLENIKPIIENCPDCPQLLDLYKLLNSCGLNPDTKIHRIFEKEFYEQDLKNNCLTLPWLSNRTWDGGDLENPLSSVYCPIENIYYGSLFNTYFALCWTLRENAKESDWKSFANGKSAVRISTTVGKLMDQVLINYDCITSTYLLRVKYMNESEIKKMKTSITEVINRMINDTGVELAAGSAIVEDCYICEQEVRLIFDYGRVPSRYTKKCIRLENISSEWNDFLDNEVQKINKNGNRKTTDNQVPIIRLPFKWDGFVDNIEYYPR